MAKKSTVLLKLQSSESSHYYVIKKNPKKHPEKIALMKYDPKLRKHVMYNEKKLK